MEKSFDDNVLRKPRLLVFIQWFTPGYKSGGPVRAVQNFVDLFHEDFDIFIVTGDKDIDGNKPYSNIRFNQWLEFRSQCKILYLTKDQQTGKKYKYIYRDINPHTIYLNSLYSYRYSILPLMAAKQFGFQGKIVMATRGMLKESAMNFKRLKKRGFLFIARHFNLFNKVSFLATDEQEVLDISRWLNVSKSIIHQMDDPPFMVHSHKSIIKKEGELKLVLVGRVHPIKGIDFLINVLRSVKSKVQVKIIGWIENKEYYKTCVRLAGSLPENNNVEFIGDIPFDQVIEQMVANHFMVLPTKGENYGHSIFESLSAGRPVIISDQTPWRLLEDKGIGWDISLNQPDQFVIAIEKAAMLNQEEYNQMSSKAVEFSKNYIKESNIKEKYKALFN